jgi:hypothetical protein
MLGAYGFVLALERGVSSKIQGSKNKMMLVCLHCVGVDVVADNCTPPLVDYVSKLFCVSSSTLTVVGLN